MRLPGRRVGIGVALGPGTLTGVVLGSPARPELVEAPGGTREGRSAGEWLEEGFRRLASRLDATHGRSLEGAEVAVALLPPFADARLLTLPPLRRGELEAVVRRDAARHFIGVEGPRVVGVRLPRTGASGPTPVLAAAASAPFLEAVRRAISAVGWSLESVAPAQAAWLRAGPRGKRSEGLVVATKDGTAHVARLEGGAPVALRRVPLDLPDELAAATGRGRGPAVIFGEASRVRSVTELVERGGWVMPRGSATHATAAEAAARHAADAEPELVPPTLAAERADRARGNTLRMAGLAAVLLVAAAAVHLWGAKRELDAVRAQRAEIREEVAPVVAARDSLDALNARLATIDGITDRSPRWTRALYELALLLPRDAHLTALVASDTSVEIEAEATRAGAAIQALRGAESLRDVRLLGLVERELEDGETVVERFRLEARLAPLGDPSAVDAGRTDARPPGTRSSEDGPADGGSAGDETPGEEPHDGGSGMERSGDGGELREGESR